MKDIVSEAIKGTVSKITKNKDDKFVGIKNDIQQAIEYLQIAMFPSYFGQNFDICTNCPNTETCKDTSDSERRIIAFRKASDYLIRSFSKFMDYHTSCDKVAAFIDTIPGVLELLDTDIKAAYKGDPAASCIEEIILAYPTFQAICIYRLAHILFTMDIPVIPRIMTEYGHELTGIDIHPGAKIGSGFFIDHGTGVVIGETAIIGDNVKLYQHVTIGAKSQKSMQKGNKRHPNIGNNVVIYAGTTILGGDVFIGDNSIIGGNVWLTQSVPENTTVYSTPAELKMKN